MSSRRGTGTSSRSLTTQKKQSRTPRNGSRSRSKFFLRSKVIQPTSHPTSSKLLTRFLIWTRAWWVQRARLKIKKRGKHSAKICKALKTLKQDSLRTRRSRAQIWLDPSRAIPRWVASSATPAKSWIRLEQDKENNSQISSHKEVSTRMKRILTSYRLLLSSSKPTTIWWETRWMMTHSEWLKLKMMPYLITKNSLDLTRLTRLHKVVNLQLRTKFRH